MRQGERFLAVGRWDDQRFGVPRIVVAVVGCGGSIDRCRRGQVGRLPVAEARCCVLQSAKVKQDALCVRREDDGSGR